MKLQFFTALLAAPHGRAHDPAVHAIPRTSGAGSATLRRVCQWRRNPLTGKPEARWVKHP